MDIRYYHNPRCSKSRQGLELLRERGIEPTLIEYLKNPPSREDIEAILDRLDGEPRQLLRDNEPEFKQMGLNPAALEREQIIDAILQEPKLLQRPVALSADRAVVGRPPEKILEILA